MSGERDWDEIIVRFFDLPDLVVMPAGLILAFGAVSGLVATGWVAVWLVSALPAPVSAGFLAAVLWAGPVRLLRHVWSEVSR